MDARPARGHWDDVGLAMLLAGFFSGPAAWGLMLQANYSLVKWVCAAGQTGVLIAIGVAALVAVGGGFVLSWRCYTRLRGQGNTHGARVTDRSYFLAVVGMWLNVFFALLILTSTINHFILDPCR